MKCPWGLSGGLSRNGFLGRRTGLSCFSDAPLPVCHSRLISHSLQVLVPSFRLLAFFYSVRDSLQELKLRETLTWTCPRPAFLSGLLLAVPGSTTLHPVPSVRGPQDLSLVPWTLPSVGPVISIPFSGWRLGTWGVLQVTLSSAWTPGFHWHLTSLTLTSWPQKVPRPRPWLHASLLCPTLCPVHSDRARPK